MGTERERDFLVWFWLLLYAHQTPKHIRGGWSHYTDTSKPVDANGAITTWSILAPRINMVVIVLSI
jgi:hypothetical protein